MPSFKADLVFQADRFSRGGDHTPFSTDGFAAVRFTTPPRIREFSILADHTLDKTSPSYTANVARVNAAAVLRWKDRTPWRTSPVTQWSHAPQLSFPGARELSIDDIVLGVKAIDKERHESLVSPYIAPLYVRMPITLK